MLKKIYIVLLSVFLLSSCTMNKYFFDITKPGAPDMKWIYDHPPENKNNGKPYPELYVDGWRDGCETGVAGNTNTFYKFYHNFKQDAMKAQDETYHKGWYDAFFYCGRYIYQYNRKLGF